MPRPTIICPSCQRELYHLHRPQCSWCGADLSKEQFERVSLPPGDMPATDLPPQIPETQLTGYSQNNLGLGFFSQQPTFRQKQYQIDLNTTQIVLLVCLLLIPAAYFFWQKTQVYPASPPAYHSR